MYVYGINLISSRDISGNDKYYLYNAHGDVVQLINGSGVVVDSYNYDAFGVEYDINDNDVNPFRYAGQYFDQETETYYLRARYYNPSNGRFTQQDGWEYFKYDDALSLNLYTYCNNNPIMYIDLDGHSIVIAGIVFTVAEVLIVGGLFLLTLYYTNPEAANLLVYKIFSGLTEFVDETISSAKEMISILNGENKESDKAEKSIAVSTPASPDPDKDPKRNWEDVKEKWLEKKLKEQGTDPHKVKQEYLGKDAKVSRYDIRVDKNSGQLAIFDKSGNLVEITHYYIK